MDAELRQELLLRVAAGELQVDSDEFRAAFAGDPAALQEAREWLATVAVFERSVAHDQEDAGATVEPADRDLARAFIDGQTQIASPRGPRWLWFAAAAVVLVGLALGVRSLGTETLEGSSDERLFLGASLELLVPRGSVEEWDAFEWKPYALPAGGSYRLVAEADGEELLRRERLNDVRYAPTEDERARLDAESEWTWRVFAVGAGAGGGVLAMGTAHVARP